jgi:Na+-transporting methylmalonyl-CoA/oxaloacetate decarboxylase gamma subunit
MIFFVLFFLSLLARSGRCMSLEVGSVPLEQASDKVVPASLSSDA